MGDFPAHLINTISQGDTLECMRQLPDECVDLVVTSPPYGVGKAYEKRDNGTQEPLWHTIWLGLQCFKQYARIVRPGGYVAWNFGDNAFGRLVLSTEVLTTIPMGIWYWQIGHKTGFELQATRIWRKNFAAVPKPFFLNHYPRPVFDYEHIWTFRKPDGTGKEIVNEHKIGRRGVWDTTKDGLDEMGEENQTNVMGNHKAAFPLAIPKWAIMVYSQPGAIVLDNFIGTGTTAVAAEELGRQWYGIERGPEWVAYARERILTARTERARRAQAGTQTRLEIA